MSHCVYKTKQSWETIEVDQVSNLWLKYLTVTHRYLAESFNKSIEEEDFPTWITTEVTFLLLRNEDTGQL
jgi:hypothetical protein